MTNRSNQILNILQEKGEVSFKPHGNSMVPKIHSGDLVRVKAVEASIYQVGDIVYCKVKGNYYLHILVAIDFTNSRFQIANNRGHINGWIGSNSMYGLCIEVAGKILVSEEELNKRKEN